jgi:hypothetical protein
LAREIESLLVTFFPEYSAKTFAFLPRDSICMIGISPIASVLEGNGVLL